jgi:hypothetical protein
MVLQKANAVVIVLSEVNVAIVSTGSSTLSDLLYTYAFFFYWEIFRENCIAEHFRSFVNNLRPFITDSDFVLFDNATIQTEEESLQIVEEVFHGLLKRVPAYSPRFSPIERGFSVVWGEIRRNSEHAMIDPEGAINAAFTKYSVWGPYGHVGKSLYNTLPLILFVQ